MISMLSSVQLRLWGPGAAGLPSWPAIIAVVIVVYISICSFLRFRQLSKIRSRHKFPDRAACSRMTGTDAQAIIESAYTYEFPLFFGLSLTYALFKVSSSRLYGPFTDTKSNPTRHLPLKILRSYSTRQVILAKFATRRNGNLHLFGLLLPKGKLTGTQI